MIALPQDIHPVPLRLQHTPRIATRDTNATQPSHSRDSQPTPTHEVQREEMDIDLLRPPASQDTTRNSGPIWGQIESGSTVTFPCPSSQPGPTADIHQNYGATNRIHLLPNTLASDTRNIHADIQQPAPANQYRGNAQVRESLEGLRSLVQVPANTAAVVCLTFDQFHDLQNGPISSTSRSDQNANSSVPQRSNHEDDDGYAAGEEDSLPAQGRRPRGKTPFAQLSVHVSLHHFLSEAV